MLKKLGDGYKVWHVTLQHIPKLSRFTLGTKIDTLFVETVEFVLMAGYAPRSQKLSIIKRASSKLDSLKFFLQLAWEIKNLDDSKYLAINDPLIEAGKMLGGWQRQLEKENNR
ncbi:MAG: four helix bundle protein [Candidatus Andersenbacteria bacterium]